jgi:hypothetical protein
VAPFRSRMSHATSHCTIRAPSYRDCRAQLALALSVPPLGLFFRRQAELAAKPGMDGDRSTRDASSRCSGRAPPGNAAGATAVDLARGRLLAKCGSTKPVHLATVRQHSFKPVRPPHEPRWGLKVLDIREMTRPCRHAEIGRPQPGPRWHRSLHNHRRGSVPYPCRQPCLQYRRQSDPRCDPDHLRQRGLPSCLPRPRN